MKRQTSAEKVCNKWIRQQRKKQRKERKGIKGKDLGDNRSEEKEVS